MTTEFVGASLSVTARLQVSLRLSRTWYCLGAMMCATSLASRPWTARRCVLSVQECKLFAPKIPARRLARWGSHHSSTCPTGCTCILQQSCANAATAAIAPSCPLGSHAAGLSTTPSSCAFRHSQGGPDQHGPRGFKDCLAFHRAYWHCHAGTWLCLLSTSVHCCQSLSHGSYRSAVEQMNIVLIQAYFCRIVP